jgi:hypothetical protein
MAAPGPALDLLPPRARRALDAFLAPWLARRDVVGIVLCGSASRGRMDPNSDLDLHVVLAKAARRTRGNVRVHGVEVEYFVNPVVQVEQYLGDEGGGRHTAHMFATGIVLKDSAAMRRLVRRARAALRAPWPRRDRARRETDRYMLDDGRKDLEDLRWRGDRAGHALQASRLVDRCVETLFAHRRVRVEKIKDLVAGLRALDPAFARAFERAACATTPDARHRATLALVRATERRIGGARPTPWRLSGPLVGLPRRPR